MKIIMNITNENTIILEQEIVQLKGKVEKLNTKVNQIIDDHDNDSKYHTIRYVTNSIFWIGIAYLYFRK